MRAWPGAALFVLCILILTGCGGPPPALEIGRSTDAPTVYRVSVGTESRFPGPVSDLEGGTDLTAAFEARPVSDSAVEVEILYLAANIRDAEGEPVALDLGRLTGEKVEVVMGPPGEISEIRGDPALLEASIPLIPLREVIASLFPPLPQEELREGDTWTGDVPIPFANLDGPPQRMRFLLDSINSSEGAARIEGYELRTRPRSFTSETASGGVSGEGDLDMVFDGRLRAGAGYEWTERTAEFDSQFIRLSGSGYANGSLRMESTTRVERLDSAEQFGLDSGTER
ncbi:MAG: hypothetical protein M3157_01315 [Actinomycetota bacterium]|nr:hypothetical protein [Actinomycetota bacterium]